GTRFNPPNNGTGYHQSYQTWDPSSYSDGPLEIGYQGFVPGSSVGFITACEIVNVPIVRDLNSGNGTGVKQGTGTLSSKYRRSSAYDSYYKRAIHRSNLDVLHYSPVQDITFDKTATGTPVATGVVFVDQQTGIAPVLINENIGQHIMAISTPEASTNQWIFNITKLAASQAEFYANASGHYTAPSGITNAFQMLSVEHLQSMGASAVIDAGLTNRSTVEFLFESIFYPEGPTPSYMWSLNQSYISVTASSMVALSQGNITIQSNSMADAPLINPNFLPDLLSPTTTMMLLEYIKATTLPNWHSSGTNRMLPLADGGVVDPRLRVYGVKGLRVVDSSVMPTVPDVNIQGPVFMIGEHGAKMIREDWQF
ncbi:hypothetical protein LTR28_005519, partial [Elasticomyces elasticus]